MINNQLNKDIRLLKIDWRVYWSLETEEIGKAIFPASSGLRRFQVRTFIHSIGPEFIQKIDDAPISPLARIGVKQFQNP